MVPINKKALAAVAGCLVLAGAAIAATPALPPKTLPPGTTAPTSEPEPTIGKQPTYTTPTLGDKTTYSTPTLGPTGQGVDDCRAVYVASEKCKTAPHVAVDIAGDCKTAGERCALYEHSNAGTVEISTGGTVCRTYPNTYDAKCIR
jgi:hypothetical protein